MNNNFSSMYVSILKETLIRIDLLINSKTIKNEERLRLYELREFITIVMFANTVNDEALKQAMRLKFGR